MFFVTLTCTRAKVTLEETTLRRSPQSRGVLLQTGRSYVKRLRSWGRCGLRPLHLQGITNLAVAFQLLSWFWGLNLNREVFPPCSSRPWVSAARSSAFAAFAGKSDMTGPDSATVPILPGRLLGLTQVEWPRLPCSFQQAVLPPGVLKVSDNDRFLLSPDLASKAESSNATVRISVKSMRAMEGLNRAALEIVSVADSLLSGVGLLLSPEEGVEQGSEESDRDSVFSLLSSLGFCFSSLAGVLSRSYADLVVARRDAFLEASAFDTHAKASFRALPLSSTDLFGPQVQGMVHTLSERARDSALLRPQAKRQAAKHWRKRPAVSTPGAPPPKVQRPSAPGTAHPPPSRFRDFKNRGRGKPRGGRAPQ